MDARGEPATATLATLGQRILAQVVDGFLAFGTFMFVGLTLAPRFGGATATGFQLEGAPALLVTAVVTGVLLAYFTFFETLFGATLGKVSAGIRVRRLGGGRITLGAALLRNLLRALDGLGVYLVGAVLIMVTKQRQRLGDLAARSVVVQRPTAPWARIAAVAVALALAAVGVFGGYRIRGPVGPGADFPARPTEQAGVAQVRIAQTLSSPGSRRPPP
ncbi:MAG: RDD family protein [Armatimonadota bacterium]|nr:RDD family protein [Armatimonadota bacterium]MDR7428326.1 RDD family protein [Armatimonadota bacterium]MDR7465470.1 RDD family protein [Armatimonadota bacterium]MDR7470234.1 RDD family protein [Armatimonadota bacterium]MDR7475586.1 RDD family protein [Armatimonadota bacterium]